MKHFHTLTAGLLLLALPLCAAEQQAKPEHPNPTVETVQAIHKIEDFLQAAATASAAKPPDKAAAEENLNQAVATANEILAKVEPTSYDAALANLMLAQAFTQSEQYKKAIPPLRAAFESGQWDEKNSEHYGTALAHLYMEVNQTKEALDTLDQVFAQVKNPNPQTYYLDSAILLQVASSADTEKGKALKEANDAKSDAAKQKFQAEADAAEKKHDKFAARAKEQALKALQSILQPPPEYYQLLAACAQETKDYDTAVACIEHLVELKPDNATFWGQLVATQYGQGNNLAALVALDRAQAKGMLTEEKYDLIRIELLVSLDRYKEAAEYLKEGLTSGKLTSKENLWVLWANCYDQLFEPKKATQVLQLASEKTKFSTIDMRLAERNWRNKDYKATVKNLEDAWKKGHVDQPGDLWVLMASASVEMKDMDKARYAIAQARKYATDQSTKEKADRLQQYLDNLKKAQEKQKEADQQKAKEADKTPSNPQSA